MNAEQFFSEKSILDLSFFNFRSAITAAYFANQDLEILRVNDNFKSFFPILGNVTNASLLDVLEQLHIPGKQIDTFVTELEGKGFVLLPEVHVTIEGQEKIYSLLSTHTKDMDFSYLNGVQGQFVDRTLEWQLKKEREDLLEQKLRDREIIEEKSQQLEHLATRLAKYLSPQIYSSIFSQSDDVVNRHARKNLTLFFSDIVQFTDLSDTLEPERLALVINSYLSEMTKIAIECGGTIDKFIGDAVLVFFGDPESEGEVKDALKCVDMALRMQERAAELQGYWRKLGVPNGLRVRMGIATGFCTVGNFGSDQRLDYTVLGSPVNLAARLQGAADPDTILMDQSTQSLVSNAVDATFKGEMTPRGFSRTVSYYEVEGLKPNSDIRTTQAFSHFGEHVEVNVIDSSNIRAAIEELRQIQTQFEKQLQNT
ncbi:adenylate/guanylate cyclase domain-containing protein [Phaeobacter gallaeciensis]|uniref:Adenylate/guanylate cyclase domain-containing protein n=1 Tax=Phaeobacter gallaeciensis TaxID=60890 RepID=A0A366WR62_9RHOB|nr:adenylate/guanylate cyclase domain-containing protein [Phaeobacter gallaeciensis]